MQAVVIAVALANAAMLVLGAEIAWAGTVNASTVPGHSPRERAQFQASGLHVMPVPSRSNPPSVTDSVTDQPAQITLLVARAPGAATAAATATQMTAAVIVGRANDLDGLTIDFARIVREKEARRLLGTIALGTPRGLPLTASRLSSRYGLRTHPVSGQLRMHRGIDLAAAHGTPITATSDGIVSSATWAGGYGLMVALENARGVETRFAHMSRMAVAPGQRVKAGQVIGYVGSTGLSTGPHVHYEIRVNGQSINPLGH